VRHYLSALALCFVTTQFVPSALADEDTGYGKSDWPLSVVKRPVVPAKSMLEIRGDTLRANLSKDSVLEPISLAPDIFYGINDKLAFGITHDTGICVTGTEGGCAKAYNDVGVEVNFSLMGRGSFLLAVTGGVGVLNLSDPLVVGANLGFLTKIIAGKLAIVAKPRVYVGITERDTFGDVADVPVEIHYAVQPQTDVAIETGFSGALDDLGGANAIPVGLSALFAINEKIDIGAAVRFTNIAGTDGSADGREAIARFNLRL
jgi:hypothetical protein